MRAEDSVPLDEKILVLEGRLHEARPIRGLPSYAKHEECFFSRYAYADLPLPKCFDVVFQLAAPSRAEFLPICIEAATQQFGFADTQIPHGWKMLCWLGESGAASQLLGGLPKVEGWFESKETVGLASRESWEAFRAKMASKALEPTPPA